MISFHPPLKRVKGESVIAQSRRHGGSTLRICKSQNFAAGRLIHLIPANRKRQRFDLDQLKISGGATPGFAKSNDLAGRSTALARALALPCLALRITLLR